MHQSYNGLAYRLYGVRMRLGAAAAVAQQPRALAAGNFDGGAKQCSASAASFPLSIDDNSLFSRCGATSYIRGLPAFHRSAIRPIRR